LPPWLQTIRKGKRMTTDDKFGLGVGCLALGLAAGWILLAQLVPGGFLGLSRDLLMPEAIFDGIVCVLGIPAGIYFLYQGARAEKQGQP
jgi:hypothetical protein